MIFHQKKKFNTRSFLSLFLRKPPERSITSRSREKKIFNKNFLEIDKIVSERKVFLLKARAMAERERNSRRKHEKVVEGKSILCIINIVFYYTTSGFVFSIDVCFACTYEFLTMPYHKSVSKPCFLQPCASKIKEKKPHFIPSIIV